MKAGHAIVNADDRFADLLSRLTDRDDRSTAGLFGDGAGAVVIRGVETEGRIGPVVIGADEPISEAERLIKTYRVSGLPVVVDGTAIGVVSQTDLGVARSSEMISAN